MYHVKRVRWLIQAVCIALAAALLAGGLGPGVALTAKARKSASPRLQQVFSNTSPIAVSDGGQAPPSQILVSGFETEIADVNVTLHNLSHGVTHDLDVLLVGPGGQTAFLISDVGTVAANDTVTLDDQAASQVSSSAAIETGTFQPTNFQSGDSFAPPAPTSPSSSAKLGVFNSTDPNGVWTLHIRDDSFGGTGTLAGGWTLRITSANGVPDASPDSFDVQAGKSLSVPPFGVLANDLDPDNDILTAILAGKPKKGQVRLESDGSFTYRPSKKAKGTDSFTYLAQDSTGLTDLETVTIQIKKAKKKKGRK